MNTMTSKLLGVTALRVREPATDLADLGEHSGCAHNPAPEPGLEGVSVGVQDQLTDRHSRPVTAMALSLVDGHRAPGSRHLGRIGDRSATTDRKRVPQ